MAMIWVFRSTGPPMKTSPSSFTGRDLSRMGVEGEVFGNMDYGKKDPSLGWRYTDAWMSMAGMGDVGEPNGLPVDEWGIRVNENSQPTGSCVARGGATNSLLRFMLSPRQLSGLRNTLRLLLLV